MGLTESLLYFKKRIWAALWIKGCRKIKVEGRKPIGPGRSVAMGKKKTR